MKRRILYLLSFFLCLTTSCFSENISSLLLKAEEAHQEVMRLLDCSEWDKGPISEEMQNDITKIRIARIPSVLKNLKNIKMIVLHSDYFRINPEKKIFVEQYFNKIDHVLGYALLILGRNPSIFSKEFYYPFLGQMIERNIFHSYAIRFGLDKEMIDVKGNQLLNFVHGMFEDDISIAGVFVFKYGSWIEVYNPLKSFVVISDQDLAKGIIKIKSPDKVILWAKIITSAPSVFQTTKLKKEKNLFFCLKGFIEKRISFESLNKMATEKIK